jgi:hypothetical protein
MSQIFLRASATLLPFLLAACSMFGDKPDKEEQEGIVVFSVSHDLNGGPRDQAVIYLDGGAPGGPEGTNFLSSERSFLDEVRDSDFSNAVGYVHAVTLPAGRHSFTNWQILNGTGHRISPDQPPEALEFTVQPGRVTYLGAFHAELVRGKNAFGTVVTRGGRLIVRDERERDTAVLLARHPDYRDKIIRQPLATGPWSAGAVEPVQAVPDRPLR